MFNVKHRLRGFADTGPLFFRCLEGIKPKQRFYVGGCGGQRGGDSSSVLQALSIGEEAILTPKAQREEMTCLQ